MSFGFDLQFDLCCFVLLFVFNLNALLRGWVVVGGCGIALLTSICIVFFVVGLNVVRLLICFELSGFIFLFVGWVLLGLFAYFVWCLDWWIALVFALCRLFVIHFGVCICVLFGLVLLY